MTINLALLLNQWCLFLEFNIGDLIQVPVIIQMYQYKVGSGSNETYVVERRILHLTCVVIR